MTPSQIKTVPCAVDGPLYIVSLPQKTARVIFSRVQNLMIQQRWCYSPGKPGGWRHCRTMIMCVPLKEPIPWMEGWLSGSERLLFLRWMGVHFLALTSDSSQPPVTLAPGGLIPPFCPQWTLNLCVCIYYKHADTCTYIPMDKSLIKTITVMGTVFAHQLWS